MEISYNPNHRRKFITVKELSEHLSIHPQTVYSLVRESRIPFIRMPGAGIRFKLEDVEEMLEKYSFEPHQTPEIIYPRFDLKAYDKLYLKKGGIELSKTRWNYGYGGVFTQTTKSGIKRFYIWFYDENRKRIERVVKNARTRTEAVIALEYERQQAFARKYQPEKVKQVITFKDFSNLYLTQYAKPRKKSWQTDEIFLNAHLVPFFGSKELSDISVQDVNRYIVKRQSEGVKNSTINVELSTMRRMLNLAVEWGYSTKNPVCRKIFLKEVFSKRDRVLSYEEEDRLLKHSAEHMKQIIRCALSTGMRKGEILSLKWENVDLEKRLIKVKAELSKSGKERSIPVNDTLLEMFKKMKAMNYGKSKFVFLYNDPRCNKLRAVKYIRMAFSRACRRAGVQNLTFHGLRHTAGTRLIQNGVDPVTVKNILGHENLKTTEIYLHSNLELMRMAVESLDNGRKNLRNIYGIENREERTKHVINLFPTG